MRSAASFLLLLTFALCALALPTWARSGGSGYSTHVRGHSTRRGNYVMPHYRSHPNRTRVDNWSTHGNVNPYTGKAGTKRPTK
jgi:hypothetical protein